MLIAIDIGNTATKVGMFSPLPRNPNPSLRVRDADRAIRLPNNSLAALKESVNWPEVTTSIVCSTAGNEMVIAEHVRQWSGREVVVLSPSTPLPIINGYGTPETVGMDRIAAACAAHFLAKEYNDGVPSAAAVIDCGTAVTFDIIDATGTFLGGNIAPGLSLRLKALHEHTAHLPLLEPTEEEVIAAAENAFGHTTRQAILCGVVQGIQAEINGFVQRAEAQWGKLCVFLTAQPPFHLADTAKSRTFAAEFLVLKGLDLILRHALSKTNAH